MGQCMVTAFVLLPAYATSPRFFAKFLNSRHKDLRGDVGSSSVFDRLACCSEGHFDFVWKVIGYAWHRGRGHGGLMRGSPWGES